MFENRPKTESSEARNLIPYDARSTGMSPHLTWFVIAVLGAVLTAATPREMYARPDAVAVSRAGVLRGRVETELGESIADARVWVLELGQSTRTSADGSFRFPDVAPGIYQVLVETELRIAVTDTATVEPGEIAELVLVVGAGATLRVN